MFFCPLPIHCLLVFSVFFRQDVRVANPLINRLLLKSANKVTVNNAIMRKKVLGFILNQKNGPVLAP